jgi:hypothetical protein
VKVVTVVVMVVSDELGYKGAATSIVIVQELKKKARFSFVIFVAACLLWYHD